MATTTEDLIIDQIQEIFKDNDIWTPEFLAKKFWYLTCKKQAEFFNILSNISDACDAYELQGRAMRDHLSPSAKRLIDKLKLCTD